jgi:alkylation response protein AidB-like acyl-CoA dehydrogenase
MRGYLVAAVNEPRMAPRAARLTVRTARKIAESCIQTHGAIGFTWDLGLHRYLRHAMAAERLLAQFADSAA